MAQIKIINFELAREERLADAGMYQLHVDFEFIVSKVELIEQKKYAVQFSIGGSDHDNQQFKLVGCEIPLVVSIGDYRNDLLRKHIVDEHGRLHYILQHVCRQIPATDIEQNRKISVFDSVFVMADLFTAENHLLLGFTGSAAKPILDHRTFA